MKVNMIKPKERLKAIPINANDIYIHEKDEWNSFSMTPQEDEKWELRLAEKERKAERMTV